jgi:DNA-binding NarL/FixJ family response regulator
VFNRVLIVDDNESVRRLIRACVESIGLNVCGEAENGLLGVQRAKELNPDVILLDLSMPEMNGAEAASVLKSALPDTYIILFTMYEFGDALAAAVGVDVVLCKTDGVGRLTAYLKGLRRKAVRDRVSLADPTASESNPAASPSPRTLTTTQDPEPFDIFRVLGEDELVWLGSSATFDEANSFVQKSQPGIYIVYSQKTESKATIVITNDSKSV